MGDTPDYVNLGGRHIDGPTAIVVLCVLLALIVLVSLWTGSDKDGE